MIYATVDWQEANRPLFTALALERRIGVVIIALIILIAALNITTTLILVVMERRRDIAILNAMGATARSIMSIFVIEGAMVGAVGAVWSAAGSCSPLLSQIVTSSSVCLQTFIQSATCRLSLNVPDMALAALMAFVLSVIATIYPARAAARVRPAEMLRDTQ